MLRRWAIRIGMGLVGAAAGLVISDVVLTGLHISAQGVVEATLIFWVVHVVVSFLALRVLIRQPSIAIAGLLALLSTIVSLVIVNLVVSGLSVHGLSTYLFAALIIWATTATCDFVGLRMIRTQRVERRQERRAR